jgi:hypothetical protein
MWNDIHTKSRISDLKGRNVGIIDGRDLWSAPLRWAEVA